jgi:hypothetical protein
MAKYVSKIASGNTKPGTPIITNPNGMKGLLIGQCDCSVTVRWANGNVTRLPIKGAERCGTGHGDRNRRERCSSCPDAGCPECPYSETLEDTT